MTTSQKPLLRFALVVALGYCTAKAFYLAFPQLLDSMCSPAQEWSSCMADAYWMQILFDPFTMLFVAVLCAIALGLGRLWPGRFRWPAFVVISIVAGWSATIMGPSGVSERWEAWASAEYGSEVAGFAVLAALALCPYLAGIILHWLSGAQRSLARN